MKIPTKNIKAASGTFFRFWKSLQESIVVKSYCIIGASLLISAGLANAQKTDAKFVLNNAQSPLKNFAVASGMESRPAFVDINGDGKVDCFSGEFKQGGNAMIYFFKNEGSNSSPQFKQISGSANPLAKVSIPGLSIPYFVDIDKDGDYDCFVGDEHSGGLRFYKNVGSKTNPEFQKQSAAFNPLSMVKFSASNTAEPAFADIDGDGDYDCLVTDVDGSAYFYKNVGTPTDPVFERAGERDNPFTFLEASPTNKASFYDWNNDGLVDLFIGTKFYKNTGTATSPAFTLNTTDGPKFSDNSDGFPLRWVNLNNKSVAIVTGNISGGFNFFTVASSESELVINAENTKAYPNPSKDQFMLSLPPRGITETIIRITDAQGRIIATQKASGDFIKFGKELKTGVYFLEVMQNEKVLSRQKIVKG